MDSNLASSIPLNKVKPAAQYIKLRDGNIHTNLCGQISIEMIYETVTGKNDALQDVYDNLPADGGTAFWELSKLVEKTFPGQWSAVAYYGAGEYHYGKNSSYYQVALPRNWYLNEDGKNQMLEIMRSLLSEGSYLIVGTRLNTRNGRQEIAGVPHWVVVTGITGYNVRINDPYDNSEEWYSWNDIWGSINACQNGLIAISNTGINPETAVRGMK